MMKNITTTEMRLLQELERLPQDLAGNNGKLNYYVENNTIVSLSIRYCGLTPLPDSISQLAHLEHLDLTGNRLTALPEWLGTLTTLRTLALDDNLLTDLPESLGNLANLKELHIDV